MIFVDTTVFDCIPPRAENLQRRNTRIVPENLSSVCCPLPFRQLPLTDNVEALSDRSSDPAADVGVVSDALVHAAVFVAHVSDQQGSRRQNHVTVCNHVTISYCNVKISACSRAGWGPNARNGEREGEGVRRLRKEAEIGTVIETKTAR